jgi:hypothetical protein
MHVASKVGLVRLGGRLSSTLPPEAWSTSDCTLRAKLQLRRRHIYLDNRTAADYLVARWFCQAHFGHLRICTLFTGSQMSVIINVFNYLPGFYGERSSTSG